MTHIGVEKHTVPKRIDARAINIVCLPGIYKISIVHNPQKRHQNIQSDSLTVTVTVYGLTVREKADDSM
jgi:hypothetical protein